MGEGSIFGEVGLLLDEVRTATARATSASELLEVTRDDFLASLNEGETWARKLLLDTAQVLAERMGTLDAALVELIGRLPTDNAAELERLRSHLFTKWSF